MDFLSYGVTKTVITPETKTTPVTMLLKDAAKIKSGAKDSKKEKVATISREKALEIAKYKLADSNAYDEEAMLRMIAGSAKQMGIVIEGVDPLCAKKRGNK